VAGLKTAQRCEELLQIDRAQSDVRVFAYRQRDRHHRPGASAGIDDEGISDFGKSDPF
jgi:hypothetical protein